MGGITLNVWVAALFYDPVEKHMKKVLIDEETQDLEPEEQPLNKAKFILNLDDNSSSMNYLNRNDSFTTNAFLSNSVSRSPSSSTVQYYKSPGGKERKISGSVNKGDMMRESSGIGLQSNVNSSTGLSNVNSINGLNYINSSTALDSVPETTGTTSEFQSQVRIRKISRAPKRSPSSSSFQYVSTPYHGSTLTLQPETFASTFSLGGSATKNKNSNAPQTKKFIDISLLKDPIYLIILISNSTNAISYTNFIILLPSYAVSLGFDKTSGTLLIPIVSALDLVGRIGGSALSDLPIIPKTWYFIGGLLISGISLALIPFAQSYTLISIYCAIFGLASGIYVGVTAVIMADLLGTDRLQSTYGISLFVNGILQLIGPPLCGLWFEQTNSYISLFCTLGIFLIGGASIWGFMPLIKSRNKNKLTNS